MTVEWTPRALKELARLDKTGQTRIRDAVESLAAGSSADVKRLRGIDPPEFRLRVGNWRVRFRIDPTTGTISILHVLKRDEAY